MLEQKIRRYKLIDAHTKMIKSGKFEEGFLILRLLRKGTIRLCLSDADYAVEVLCEEFGCRINYSSNGYTCRVIL